jgi:predicted amidohydrolase
MATVKVAACQLPEVRQDIGRALGWMETYLATADRQHVDLVCFPECYLQGYLCDARSANKQAVILNSTAFDFLLTRLSGFRCIFVFGLIERDGRNLFNSAAVVHRGKLLGCYRKTHLLSGESIFEPGTAYPTFEASGLRFGINICYDTNFSESAAAIAEQGAQLIVCPANNMMRREVAERYKPIHNEVRACRAREHGLWLISSDITGERDGRISYGPTAVIDPNGSVLAQVPLLQTGMVIAAIKPHNDTPFEQASTCAGTGIRHLE